MPRLVTAEHPSETDLLNLATGREPGEATVAAREHVDGGAASAHAASTISRTSSRP